MRKISPMRAGNGGGCRYLDIWLAPPPPPPPELGGITLADEATEARAVCIWAGEGGIRSWRALLGPMELPTTDTWVRWRAGDIIHTSCQQHRVNPPSPNLGTSATIGVCTRPGLGPRAARGDSFGKAELGQTAPTGPHGNDWHTCVPTERTCHIGNRLRVLQW